MNEKRKYTGKTTAEKLEIITEVVTTQDVTTKAVLFF
jgi:hypothetical protein